jgi:hypothetical protein
MIFNIKESNPQQSPGSEATPVHSVVGQTLPEQDHV